jgi:hypothetical protein
MTDQCRKELVSRLRDEADLCRNETAVDVANLLDEAADALSRQGEPVAYEWQGQVSLASDLALDDMARTLGRPLVYASPTQDSPND